MAPNTADAQRFWVGHEATQKLIDQYAESTADPHRDWLIDGVVSFPGAHKVLELGCHCGPVLERLESIGYDAYGIDINVESVEAAVARGHKATRGAVPACLQRYQWREFDLVVSSFCLAYQAPADLPATLAGMIRIAKQGLVLVEPMAGPGVSPAQMVYGNYVHWRHDYLNALDLACMKVFPQCQLEMTRTRQGPYEDLNGVVVARITWPK